MYAIFVISLSFPITQILQQLSFLLMRRRLLITLIGIFYGQYYTAWALVITMTQVLYLNPTAMVLTGNICSKQLHISHSSCQGLSLPYHLPSLWNLLPSLSDQQSCISIYITPSTLFLYMPMTYCFLFKMSLSLFPLCWTYSTVLVNSQDIKLTGLKQLYFLSMLQQDSWQPYPTFKWSKTSNSNLVSILHSMSSIMKNNCKALETDGSILTKMEISLLFLHFNY